MNKFQQYYTLFHWIRNTQHCVTT